MRIEDPPRRRHMVFLGGAVLANIVSVLVSTYDPCMLTGLDRWPTSMTCGYPSRSGKNREPARWRSLARDSRKAGTREGERRHEPLKTVAIEVWQLQTQRTSFTKKHSNLLIVCAFWLSNFVVCSYSHHPTGQPGPNTPPRQIWKLTTGNGLSVKDDRQCTS